MTTPNVPAWIDEQGIVWSHDCDGNVKVTLALAIPRPVVERVREALNNIAEGNVPDSIGENDVEQQLVWSQKVARAALSLLEVPHG